MNILFNQIKSDQIRSVYFR